MKENALMFYLNKKNEIYDKLKNNMVFILTNINDLNLLQSNLLNYN